MSLSVMVLSACGNNSLQTSGKGGAKVTEPGDSGVTMCTMIAASALGLRVQVPSGWSAQQLAKELKIEVTDGNGPVEMSELEVDGSQLINNGAYENKGPFQVKVTLRSVSATTTAKPGFDGCHVIGVGVLVEFQPPNKIMLTTQP